MVSERAINAIASIFKNIHGLSFNKDSTIEVVKLMCKKCGANRDIDVHTYTEVSASIMCHKCKGYSMEAEGIVGTTFAEYVEMLFQTNYGTMMVTMADKLFMEEMTSNAIEGAIHNPRSTVNALASMKGGFTGLMLDHEFPGIIEKLIMGVQSLSISGGEVHA